MTEILDKTREWSDRFGSVLRASAKTQYAHLYKGAVGGIEHVISVDNGSYYMEMWRDGSETYYATTGAAIKPLPGLAKGARLDEALDRFFTLMAKVEKDKAAMKRRLGMKAIPKKVKRFLGLAHGAAPPGLRREPSGRLQPKPYPTSTHRTPRPTPVKKNIVEKVDPEIGPSQSVGLRKPSDLSPESGISKLAKLMIRNLVGEPTARMRKQMTEEERFRRGGSPSKPVQPMHPGQRMGGGPEVNPNSKPVKKNVVALTAPGGVGNQPGSGRVKPGTPPKTYNSPQGFSGRRMGGGPGQPGTSGAGVKQYQDSAKKKARKGGTNLGQKTAQRPAPYVGSRPTGASSPLLRRRKIDDITGGRVGEGGKITPVKPAKGGPGQPTGYGSTGMPQYSYGRKAAKDCGCGPAAEVRKAVRAVAMAGRGHSIKPPHVHGTPQPGGGHESWTAAQSQAHTAGTVQRPPKLRPPGRRQ